MENVYIVRVLWALISTFSRAIILCWFWEKLFVPISGAPEITVVQSIVVIVCVQIIITIIRERK